MSPSEDTPRRKQPWYKWIARALAGIVFLVLFGCIIVWFAGAPARQMTISRETTFITEPLLPNGMVDYVSAFEQIIGPSPQSERNASVLIYAAIRPDLVLSKGEKDPQLVERLQTSLGSHRILETPYLTWSEFLDVIQSEGRIDAKQRNDLRWSQSPFDQKQLYSNAWNRVDEPFTAQWIDRNEAALTLMVEASRRPDYWVPLLPGDEPPRLMWAIFPVSERVRYVVRCLCVRAMNRVGEENYEGAWNDIMTGLRLASLLQRNCISLIEHLVASAAIDVCTMAGREILSVADLNPQRLRKMFTELTTIQYEDRMSKLFAINERIFSLDSLQAQTLNNRGDDPGLFGFETRAFNCMVDWDAVVRETNQLFDEVSAALNKEETDEMVSQLASIQQKIAVVEEPNQRDRRFKFCRSARELQRQYSTQFIPAFVDLGAIALRDKLRFELLRAVMILQICYAETGSIPGEWKEVSARTGLPIPINPFDWNSIPYTSTVSGFRIKAVSFYLQPSTAEQIELTNEIQWSVEQ